MIKALFRTLALFIVMLLIFVFVAVYGYRQLTQEVNVGQIEFTQMEQPQQYNARLTLDDEEPKNYPLKGDEWQLDARVLKWHGYALLLGFKPLFKPDRLSGRYANIENEINSPRSVFQLRTEPLVDLWKWLKENPKALPFVDAQYGSGTYLPMGDGISYQIFMSPSGLFAREITQRK